MNPFQSLASRIEGYGLDASIMHTMSTMYRTNTGKLFHATASCGRLKNSKTVRPEQVDLADKSARGTCDLCFKDVPHPYSRYSQGAYSISEQSSSLERLEKGEMTWTVISQAEMIVTMLNSLAVHPNTEPWRTEIDTLISRAQTVAELSRAAITDLSGVLRSCAVELFEGERSAMEVSYPSIGAGQGYSSGQRRVIESLWRTWRDHVAAGNSYEFSNEAAMKSAKEVMGLKPSAFEQIPQKSQLRHEDFTTLQEWLVAEWCLEVDEVLSGIVNGWSVTAQRHVDENINKPDRVVLTEPDTRYGSSRVMLMLSPFSPLRLQSNQTMVIAKVPALVGKWLEARSRSHYAWYGNVESSDEDTAEMLQFCAALLDQHGGEMSKLETVLEVARVTAN